MAHHLFFLSSPFNWAFHESYRKTVFPLLVPQEWIRAAHIQRLIDVRSQGLALCLHSEHLEGPLQLQRSPWDWLRPLLRIRQGVNSFFAQS